MAGGDFVLGVSIGQVVRATGLTERQIRYCEEKGLVNPQRTPGGHRLYAEDDLIVLMKLAKHRHHGKTLSQATTAIKASARLRQEQKISSDSLSVRLFFGLPPEGGKR